MAKTVSGKRSGRAKASGNGEPCCSFCGKSHLEVARLVGGPGVYICDACVALCDDILAHEDNQAPAVGWQGWQPMSDDELLATLPGNLTTAENVREGLQAKIDELRRRDVSWTRIGKALNMSRQAAWERFA